MIAKRWNEKSKFFFGALKDAYAETDPFSFTEVEKTFKQLAESFEIKPGEVMPLFRVLLIGLANGPALFEMVVLLGKDEVVNRLSAAISKLN